MSNIDEWQDGAIEVEIDGDDEDVFAALEVLETYRDACQCGMIHKAIDLHIEDNARAVLTPSVATVAAKFKLQLDGLTDDLCEVCEQYLFDPEVPEPAGVIQKGIDFMPEAIAKALRGRPHEEGLFPLTMRRVFGLFDRIRDQVKVFAYKHMGYEPEDAATAIRRWERLGLIERRVVRTDHFKDAYEFSRFAGAMDAGNDYTQMQRMVRDAPPMSDAELAGLEWHRVEGCAHIKGLANDLGKRALKLANGMKPAEWMKGKIRDVAADAKRARLTRSQFRSELRNQTQNYGRDWDRIAATEFANMEDWGRARAIADQHGEDAWVIKIPKDTACPGCKRLYLNEDGTPRVYKLSELVANRTNADRMYLNPKTGRFVGLQPQRIAQDDAGKFTATHGGWLPVIGATHPNCGCVLVYYPAVLDWATREDKGRDHWPVTIRTDKSAAQQWEDAQDELAELLREKARERAQRRRMQ